MWNEPRSSKKGKLIVLSGPSGSGKTTIRKSLCERIPGIFWSVSATTRLRREGEVDGKDYSFTTSEDFQEKIANDEFIEYAEVHGNYYGTMRKPIEDAIEKGMDCILDIDVQGARKIKNDARYHLVLIFIEPPSLEELRRRIEKRSTESQETIDRRMQNAFMEIKSSSFYDYRIVNDNIENAIKQIQEIILANRLP